MTSMKRRCILALVVGLTATAAAPAESGSPQAPPVGGTPQKVLFLCPHGAAKSVLASAYFQQLAKERGLRVLVTSAGTEPDAAVAPAVAAHLTRQGLAAPASVPRKVSAEDLAQADVVVSLGCDLSGLPKPKGTLRTWNDIPSPSADFAAADEAIRSKVRALVDELAHQASQMKP
jgi:arsenate reductase (thioredoxin)